MARQVRMQIIVNGEPREIPTASTVAALLRQLEMDPRRVAVEVNLTLVPRTEHDRRVLAEHDRLELVTLVGGG
jgi:sulfur carrier protein